ncbi:MAG: hypothetical protein QOE03_3738 [Micromonosporaceae bacterium]|jgi:hypothetical protein|nr:hypothetical protein [Micromonosporaceae bacterium]
MPDSVVSDRPLPPPSALYRTMTSRYTSAITHVPTAK